MRRAWRLIPVAMWILGVVLPEAASAYRTQSTAGIRTVRIDVATANVTLTASDLPEFQLPDDLGVEFHVDGDTLLVTHVSEDAGDVRIALPAHMDVDLRVADGDVVIERLYGDVAVTVERGDVSLRGVIGAFDVSVGLGGINATVFLNDASKFRVRTGSIDVAVLDDVSHPITAYVERGAIRIAVTTSYGASLDAHASMGEIRSDLPIEAFVDHLLVARERHGEGANLVGELAGGGPLLELVCHVGDIELVRVENSAPGPTDSLAAPYVARGILIDGVLEGAWLEPRVTYIGDPTSGRHAELQVAWDSRRLYVALVAYESDPSALRLAATGHDDTSIDQDDAFDVLIGHENHTYRVTVNMIGSVLDGEVLDDRDDLTWDSRAIARTSLYPSAWIVELAVPYCDLGWDLGEGTRLGWNVVRVRPGEEAWDEWHPEGGEIVLTAGVSEDVPRIAIDLVAEGNAPHASIARAIGFPLGGRLLLESLPLLEERAVLSGWFEDVGAEVAADDEAAKATGVLRLATPRMRRVAEVRVFGAGEIPAHVLHTRFGWRPGWYSDATLEHRRRLTELGYRQWGFTHASVALQWQGEALNLRVDEGFIAGVIVEGARRVPVQSVLDAVTSVVGRPYRSDRAAEALDAVRAELSARHGAFKNIHDAGVRAGLGLRKWVLRVEEHEPLQFTPTPIIKFDRVHGTQLGLQTHVHRGRSGRTHLFAEGTYLQSIRRSDGERPRFNHELGILVYVDDRKRLSVGGRWRRATESLSWPPSTSLADATSAFVHGGAPLDFYAVEAGEVLLRSIPHPRLILEGRAGSRREFSLRRAIQTRWVKGDVESNRPITNGNTIFQRLTIIFDGRNVPLLSGLGTQEHTPELRVHASLAVTSGLFGHLEIEAGRFDAWSPASRPKQRGEWGYRFGRADVRAYVTPSPGHTFSTRAILQWADAPLPRQRQIGFGGSQTFRSHSRRNVFGDSGVVWSSEYRHRPEASSFVLGGFLDVGKAWYHNQEASAPTEQAVGLFVGVVLPDEVPVEVRALSELLRVDVAFPVSSDGSDDAKPRVWVRTELVF